MTARDDGQTEWGRAAGVGSRVGVNHIPLAHHSQNSQTTSATNAATASASGT